MQITSVSVKRTYNLGNYESIQLGVEISVEGKDTLEQATTNALESIERMLVISRNGAKEEPKKAHESENKTETPSSTKKRVTFREDNKILQSICTRISLNGMTITNEKDKAKFPGQTTYPIVTLEQLQSIYDFDDEALKAVNAAIMLNNH